MVARRSISQPTSNVVGVVEDLTPAILSLGEIQRVLHALLDEGVAIRDLVRIYEALSVAAKSGTEPDRS